MRVLFLSTKSPLPANDGHSLRTYNLLREVAKIHQVELLSFIKFPQETSYTEHLKEFCRDVRLIEIRENYSRMALCLSLTRSLFGSFPFVVQKYFKKEMLSEILRRIDRSNHDLVHLDMLPLGCYLPNLADCATLLNEHNVESALLARQIQHTADPVRKAFLKVQFQRLESFEKYALRRVDQVVCCSNVDARALKCMAPEVNVDVVPNGVDLDFFRQRSSIQEDERRIVFVGGLNWLPNLDGIRWFDREVLPIILRRLPDIKVDVIGHSNGNMRWKHRNHVVSHGFVEDIRPYLARSAVFIVPLRIGGGTRLKILDAMAMGKAVISTSIGTEGLDVCDQSDILVADRSGAFAESVLEVLLHKEKRYRLKTAARRLVEEKYSWQAIAPRLLAAYTTAVTRHRQESR